VIPRIARLWAGPLTQGDCDSIVNEIKTGVVFSPLQLGMRWNVPTDQANRLYHRHKPHVAARDLLPPRGSND
jgi:hypothetical protein